MIEEKVMERRRSYFSSLLNETNENGMRIAYLGV